MKILTAILASWTVSAFGIGEPIQRQLYTTNLPADATAMALVLTNQVKIMSASGGGVAIGDMQAATSDRVGQLGDSFPGSFETALWMAAGVGTGSNVWNRGPFNFYQGIFQIGHPYYMPFRSASGPSPGMRIYFNGNAQHQAVTNATSRNGSCLFIYNLNPWSDFNGICMPMTATNASGTAISTNSQGVPIYLTTDFGMQIGSISPNYLVGETNQAGSYVILSQANYPTFFSCNASGLAGEDPAVYSQHSYMAFDPLSGKWQVHFPKRIANVWNTATNALNVDSLLIDEVTDYVRVNSNLYLGGKIMATNLQAQQNIFGPNWPDAGSGLVFLCTSNAHFGGNNSAAWTFDFTDFHRLGFVKQSAQFPKLAHGSTAPFTIARSSNADLQSLPTDTQTLTTEMLIDSSGNAAFTTTSNYFSGPVTFAGAVTGTTVMTNFTSYAAGTAYTLTATPAQLDFGTTDPSITIANAGTYLIQGHTGVKYVSATYAGAQTITVKFRRTNNTATDLTNGGRTMELPVLTTFTGGDVVALPPIVYTATVGDIVQIFGSISATPSAGSVTADSAEIVAIRLY